MMARRSAQPLREECRIDAIAQAWSVLSCAAPVERAEQALDSVEQHLVHENEKLIRLLTPPFDKTTHDPGYIKGYLPGVRENGGQYTHGVLWVVRALAELGRTERATKLLEMLSPITHGRTPERGGGVSRGAVRDRGGCVRRCAARRARRMDVVHGLARAGCTAWRSSRCSALL